MGINATDRNRSLFLKGFNLSNSGANEDPTYLGFKFVFDFGSLPVNLEYGWAPSPLLRIPNYTSVDGAANMPKNLFGQPQYQNVNSNVTYYSAYNYLLQRDGSYFGSNGLKRANTLKQFQILLNNINSNSPWFFQSIQGLDKLEQIALSGFQDERGFDSFDPARTNEKTLTIECLESLNLRMTALANLYNQATFDADNMRWLVPRNLRKFTMWIYVTEIRNFFKTTRLTGASSVVSQLDDLSSLLTTDRNPGGSLANTPEGERQPSGPGAPGNAFNSFARGVLSQSGLMNEIDAFRNQQDQSGIKPVLIYELSQCEFDFSGSTPLQSTTDIGTQQPSAATQSFKIHVGKVRMKTQYPNIRSDNSYLVLADGYDQNRSSVQIYDDSLDLETIASLGREALTNITSQAISDLINEGISQYINPALSGIDQASLGNIYSFNPSQLARLTNQGGQFGFNNAQNFLNGAADTGIDNVFKGNLPTPQSMGLGGPPDRLYPIIQTNKDVYSGVPGPDLGVPDRVYPAPGGDVYSGVPGPDLGVPDRVYPAPGGDVYPGVPGPDLGVPGRIYPDPTGDVYSGVPGPDLGVPDRVYPAPGGDVYPDVPGPDLGVPGRVYPAPGGDVYPDVPGPDLGVPGRVYPDPTGDVYPDVPGPDLGVPDRVYSPPAGDLYPTSPGSDLGVPDRVYPAPGGDVYPTVPGGYLGVPDRVYKDPSGKVYPDPAGASIFPGQDIGKVYSPETLISSGSELRSPENTFSSPPSPVYAPSTFNYQRGEIGKIYPPTSGDFIAMAPIDLGNTKGEDRFNISLGTLNPPDQTDSPTSPII
jgi:hypothetical protein